MRAAATRWALGVFRMLTPYEGRRCDCRTRHTPPPNLRTHVTPAVLTHWRELGWRIHVIGQAAYAHDPVDHLHLIVGVWPRRGPIPLWSHRLGQVSPGYERRLDRCWHEQAWRRLARDAHGRFLALMPWYRWPQPLVYRWDGQR